MRAELTAAKRCIAELRERLADQRGDAEDSAGKVAVAVTAAAGALGLAAALRRWRRRIQRPARARDEVQAQRQRHQAEPTDEIERAARREAELQQQVIVLTARAEQAEARVQAAGSSLSPLMQEVETLRQKLSQNENTVRQLHFDMAALQGELLEARTQGRRHQAAYLEESRQRQSLQLRLNEVRGHRGVLQYELEETDAKLTEESRQRQLLQVELADTQRQLGAERRAWQTTRAQLVQHAQQEQKALLTDNNQLRGLLAELKPRAELAASTITKLQNEASNQKRRHLEELEALQMKQLADFQAERNRLSSQNEQTSLLDSKQQNQLPARSGTVDKIVGTTLVILTHGAEELGAGTRVKNGDRKQLPPKEPGTPFVITRVPEPKRLPPKRE